MKLNSLTAISPIDGRYRKKLEELSLYFSELALIKYRVKIEVLYLMKLAEIKVIRKLNVKEKDFLKVVYLFELKRLIKQIRSLAKKNKSLAMLARTHGQAASPTTLGKELAVFVHRLKCQLKLLPQLTGKLKIMIAGLNFSIA